MNIGDVMFQLIVFIMFAAVIFAAVLGFKDVKNRKVAWRKSLTACPKITINRLGQRVLP
ncbi:hypothetical protein SFC70_01510 [Bacillus subtilis]